MERSSMVIAVLLIRKLQHKHTIRKLCSWLEVCEWTRLQFEVKCKMSTLLNRQLKVPYATFPVDLSLGFFWLYSAAILLEFSSLYIFQIWRFVIHRRERTVGSKWFFFTVETACAINVARHRLDLHDQNPQVSLLLSVLGRQQVPSHTERFILQEFI